MIHHTINDTTFKKGQSIATVIADTISQEGKRIMTFELVYPRYIHSEFMTHRAFSRNASSSRATPISVTVNEVRNDPVFFDYVGKTQAGMVAGAELSAEKCEEFRREWESLGLYVADMVEEWSKRFGIHKQTLNRALEPWSRIRVLVTATDWENFFFLRTASDAQPEIHSLAYAMICARNLSTPVKSCYHLPYVDRKFATVPPTLEEKAMCVARCARVSYARLDGKPDDADADKALYERLLKSGHFTPFEHCAEACFGRNANLDGWISLRTMFGV